MREELFGPIVTTYVYPEHEWDETLELVDATRPYALTGAVFARDREAVDRGRSEPLRYAAGNFYINDKPTGAVVGQQPFGGARGLGDERQGRLDPGTSSAGSARGRSRRPSSRRPTTATRSWRPTRRTAPARAIVLNRR